MQLGSTDTQIKKAYEIENMSPVQIAEQMDFDIVAVKAKLMSISAMYRKACGKEEDNAPDGLNFTDDQHRDVVKVIHETALAAEYPDGSVDYKTRLAAAIYIRDDKKGRKEAVKNMAGNHFNILNFNQMLQQARLGANKAIQHALGNNGERDAIEA
jgi:hypothetical protein